MENISRWATTALLFTALGVSLSAHAAPVSGQGTWETTLQGRDLDGNLATAEAYYDTALDITWLADANAAGTLRIGGQQTPGLPIWTPTAAGLPAGGCRL